MAKKKEDIQREIQNMESQSLNTSRQMLGVQTRILETMEKQTNELSLLLAMKEKGRNLTEDEQKALSENLMTHRKYVGSLQQQVKQQKESVSLWKRAGQITNSIYSATKTYVYDYLMTADKALKETSLTMGFTAGKANDLRTAIEGSAIEAARLNMATEELIGMYSSYVDQVGRTVSMNAEQMEAMADLAKGTGLANEEAAQLAGQFELLGKDIIGVNKTVEGILETSENMGVNATKVLKAVGSNFKSLQTYTFRLGVQGMGDMAAYAEKFKVDIGTALDSAERARGLEGAVDLAAQLQVLGGEFAKSDPFEMLFLSRNDPAQFQKKISELTKGMATLNKTADGFEYQLASPMARDMLKQAGEALGFSVEQMTEMALQQKKYGDMRVQMLNAGYTKDEKEIIEGMAQMDESTGKFFVNVKGFRKDIATLGKTELEYLEGQTKSLKQRGKDAQTFDEQWNIFMKEIKAVGLPLLRGINDLLTNTIRPWMDSFTDWLQGIHGDTKDMGAIIGKYVGMFLLAMPAIKFVGGIIGKMGSIGVDKLINKMTGGGAQVSGPAGGAGGGFGSAIGKGAGVGLAGVGIGAGIGLAAEGIAKLAESMKELDSTQIWALPATVLAISVGMYTLVPAIGALGAAGTAGSIGLLALGAAAVGIGYGFKLAGEGVGTMNEGLASLINASANSSDSLFQVAGGIAAIQGALLVGGAGGLFGMIGAGTLAMGLKAVTDESEGLVQVGSAFEQINAVLRGSKEDYAEIRETVNAIASADFSNLAALSNLNQLFSQPLQVEFSDKEVGMVLNITAEMDGQKIYEQLNIPKKVAIGQKDLQTGKA